LGQFSSIEKFINTNVDIQKQLRENNPYSRFLEGIPTFVTYYAINDIESTLDEGFKDTEQQIGDESSIRYNKIEKFPLWGIENLNLSIIDEDYGSDIELTGEGIIIPNTIVPLPDEYFIINYLSKQYLFRVTNIESDTIKSNHYFKIQFEFKKMNDGTIDTQVKDIFISIFENLGTDYKVIISLDAHEKLKVIEQQERLFREMYIDLFFSRKINALILPNFSGNENIYDNFLTNFILESKIFQNDRDIFPYYFECYNDIDQSIFNKTIFNSILTKNKTYLENYNYASTMSVWDQFSPLAKFREKYNMINFYTKFSEIGNEYISIELINNIKDNIIYIDSNHKLENIIIKYLNQTDISLAEFSALNINDFYTNTKEIFLYVPIILYIIRVEIFNILLNTAK
jgi:hypothetical protein